MRPFSNPLFTIYHLPFTIYHYSFPRIGMAPA